MTSMATPNNPSVPPSGAGTPRKSLGAKVNFNRRLNILLIAVGLAGSGAVGWSNRDGIKELFGYEKGAGELSIKDLHCYRPSDVMTGIQLRALQTIKGPLVQICDSPTGALGIPDTGLPFHLGIDIQNQISIKSNK